MDVDNGSSDGTPNTTENGSLSTAGLSNGAVDVEQALLQQFNCLGTTDRDELVQELQRLLGSHLNDSTAAFYLDMNNWNLQGAICSYLDVESPLVLPSMSLISEPLCNDSESVEPNTRFEKVWHVVNNGLETWPAGCYAQRSDGEEMGGGRPLVPCLAPGHDAHIVIQLDSPATPGVHQAKWRLCTSEGAYFGDALWLIVTVAGEGTVKLTEQLSQFNALGSTTSPNATTPNNPFFPNTTKLLHSSSSPNHKDEDRSNGENDMW